jgi:predicted RNase H-like HicB family nuclease
MNYPIVIYPCDEGGYVAEVPALKGCLAQGDTLPKTLEELEFVTQLWLETAQKQGRPYQHPPTMPQCTDITITSTNEKRWAQSNPHPRSPPPRFTNGNLSLVLP